MAGWDMDWIGMVTTGTLVPYVLRIVQRNDDDGGDDGCGYMDGVELCWTRYPGTYVLNVQRHVMNLPQ